MRGSDVSVGRPPGIDRASDSTTDQLSIGSVCHVLQNERRRLALDHLRSADSPLRTSELAEAIAATENDTTTDQLGHRERKRVYISLYQVHLPTLDDAGAVQFDSDRGTIEPLPQAECLYDALDCVVEVTSIDGVSNPRTEKSIAPSKVDTLGAGLLTLGVVAVVGLFIGLFLGIEMGSVISRLLF